MERNFTVDGPDRLWVADITQRRTGQGWLYGAFVIDAWSRRVLGWALGDHWADAGKPVLILVKDRHVRITAQAAKSSETSTSTRARDYQPQPKT